MARKRVVVVAWELDEVGRALDGVRVLVDLLRHQQCPDDETAEAVPAIVSAITTLACCRLRHLVRACRGTLDPKVLAAAHNVAEDGEEHGVVLRPWAEPVPAGGRARRR